MSDEQPLGGHSIHYELRMRVVCSCGWAFTPGSADQGPVFALKHLAEHDVEPRSITPVTWIRK